MHVEIFETGRKLTERISSSIGTWLSRRGLIVRVTDDDGRVAYGEASPLPGYSPDTLEDARDRLDGAAWDRLIEAGTLSEMLAHVRALSAHPEPSPAAEFAVETVVLDLYGQRTGRPIHALLSEVAGTAAPPTGPARALPIAMLVDATSASAPEAIARAQRAVEVGIRTLKVKIGRAGAFDEELGILQAIRREIGRDIELRLDANRALDPQQLGEQLERLASVEPEFVEEPAPVELLLELKSCPVQIALDESLQGERGETVIDNARSAGRCHVVVLKPAALGGYLRCIELAAHARQAGIEVIVSHLFDGPIALAAANELALAIASPRAQALAPHAALDAWPNVAVGSLGPISVVACDTPGIAIDRQALAAWS